MAEQLTEQQKAAVYNRGGKLLVSAAAGSGKTKVLVDRILSYLTDPISPSNLDDFLIITYTKAAAAELRGKIAAKLTERIAENPENRHLQKQMQRLYLTKISTVHAFCADILREYSYKLDLSADFRVADETECLALQERALIAVLDEAYENAATDVDFRTFVDTQGFGRDDRKIPEIILSIYQKAMCHLDPKAWLEWCVNSTDTRQLSDASETIWGRYLMDDLFVVLDRYISALSRCASAASNAVGMEKPATLLYETIDQLRTLRNSKTWDDIIRNSSISYGTLSFSKKCDDLDLIGQIKVIRDSCKDALKKKLRRFSDFSERVISDIADTAPAIRGLVSLVNKFTESYKQLKRSKRILDFSDLEHYMLDLLLGKSRSGRTVVSKELSARFREVLVDEYQDSNAVQDAIFGAITEEKQNLFMVGDVKQSIYQFRLADPGIFLEKYNHFLPADVAQNGQGRKILLSKNFRSCGSVIDAANHVFSYCMSETVGGLAYTSEEALYEGVPHTQINEPDIELHAIRVESDTYAEEACFVADHICKLLDGKHMIRDKDKLRVIKPEDIVILLRSPGSVGGEFSYALEQRGLRTVTGSTTDILQTEEVQVLRSILQIVSNPLQDIALISAMCSRVFGFSADDLALIRSRKIDAPFYHAVLEDTSERTIAFLDMLSELRFQSGMCSVSELLDAVFFCTNLDSIYGAMDDGDIRRENIQYFYRLAVEFENNSAGDLARFLDHLTAMEEKGLSVSDEKNTTGAVTIMSIHKSKGLEFPVVYLCGLSKSFNMEDAREQVLSHKELGLGLHCVDRKNRVRYPTIVKNAIAERMASDAISEELRVLYVAMTRAKDRLIMTYASHSLDKEVYELSAKMDMCDSLLLTSDVSCCGDWILYSSLYRSEANAFFQLGRQPKNTVVSEKPWLITVSDGTQAQMEQLCQEKQEYNSFSDDVFESIRSGLSYRYPFDGATRMPSKQTATQLKGRYKDREASENAKTVSSKTHMFRKPVFVSSEKSPSFYGTALHAAMQYISYEACTDADSVEREIGRLVSEQYLSPEQGRVIRCEDIARLFNTEIGKRLLNGESVIREFKFSVLDDADRYDADVVGEEILLQGVVDCAIIDDDGIVILDYKTDYVTEETLDAKANDYRIQVETYAYAMEKIYKLPVKAAYLYFFRLGQFVKII